MKKIVWNKLGKIFENDNLQSWSKTHAQIPTVFVINDDVAAVFYSSRDSNNMSRIGRFDISLDNPTKVLKIYKNPVIGLGMVGSFDDSGMMPSSILEYQGRIYLYYIGWNVRNTIPYHNSIGLAISDDNGVTFKRAFEGPVMDRNHSEPYFCGTSCVRNENGIFKNWYMSCTSWEKVNGKLEPRYHLKYAESADGISWLRNGIVAIDYNSVDEGGIVRASVVREKNHYKMWFSYRSIFDYRTISSSSYKIGYAESQDGVHWDRLDHLAGIELSNDGWDSFMLAYPEVLRVKNKLYMFYNGNGFGLSGIGCAIADSY